MAPTGSGKGELVKYVKATFPEVYFSVSCTTRAMREGEAEGVNYYYLTREEFEGKIKNEEFLEWAEFGGNLYGTLKSEIVERLHDGKIVLNEIELQGVELLKPLIPEEHRTIIYIDAGGWEVSKRRALARGPMSEDELQLRYERYVKEAAAKPEADVVIENPDGKLDEAKAALGKVIADIINSTT